MVKLEFLFIGPVEPKGTGKSEKFKMKIYFSAGNRTSYPSVSNRAPTYSPLGHVDTYFLC